MTHRRLVPLPAIVLLSWACSQPAGTAPAEQAAPATPASAATCADAASQADLTACWSEEAQRIGRRVAEAQASLVSALSDDKELSGAVTRAQDAWVSYRDAQCDAFARASGGGSSERLQQAVCEARLGLEREAELARISRDLFR